MKKLLGILVLILFTLQTPSQADDIRDFQIEGMSIGDSVLDNFSEKEIKKNITFLYDSKKFATISKLEMLNIYDRIQFNFKINDSKYIIKSIEGHINFRENINNCYNKKDEISSDISDLFSNVPKNKYSGKHPADKSGKSQVKAIHFDFKDGSQIRIACTDWSKKITKQNNWSDYLLIAINSKEFMYFLDNEAWK